MKTSEDIVKVGLRKFPNIRSGWFRYVPHTRVDEFHRDGWVIVADLGRTHGYWSVLMWHCGCGMSDGG